MTLANTDTATTSAAQARHDLHEALAAGRWKPGEKLPAERVLADLLGVNRMSLRQALMALEHQGAIFRIDRRGWFVSQPRFIYDPYQHISFEQAALGQGTASWCDTRKEHISANAQDAALFGIEEGQPLFAVHGWGAFNGHRIFVHDVLINCSIAPDYGERLAHRSFTKVWADDYGIQPVLSDLMIRPVRLEGEAQQLLGTSNGAPGLYFRRIKTDERNRVLQVDREFWRFEALEIRFNL